MKTSILFLSLLAVLWTAPVSSAPVNRSAFELGEIRLTAVSKGQVAANKPKRSISQRISDHLEKARRNREAKKLMREQREKREQEEKASQEKTAA